MKNQMEKRLLDILIQEDPQHEIKKENLSLAEFAWEKKDNIISCYISIVYLKHKDIKIIITGTATQNRILNQSVTIFKGESVINTSEELCSAIKHLEHLYDEKQKLSRNRL